MRCFLKSISGLKRDKKGFSGGKGGLVHSLSLGETAANRKEWFCPFFDENRAYVCVQSLLM